MRKLELCQLIWLRIIYIAPNSKWIRIYIFQYFYVLQNAIWKSGADASSIWIRLIVVYYLTFFGFGFVWTVGCWLLVESLFKWTFRKMHFHWLKFHFCDNFELQHITRNFDIMKIEMVEWCVMTNWTTSQNASRYSIWFFHFKWIEKWQPLNHDFRLNLYSKFKKKKFNDSDLISPDWIRFNFQFDH